MILSNSILHNYWCVIGFFLFAFVYQRLFLCIYFITMAYNPNFSISDEELAQLSKNINVAGTPLNGGNANTGIHFQQNQQPKLTDNDIKAIARELNEYNGLTSDNDTSRKSFKKNALDEELNDVIFTEDDKLIKKNIETAVGEKGYLSCFFGSETFKDFAIIFLLYFFMSQNAVKDFWGQIFSALNPDDEGKVGASGIFVYGLIFAIIFVVIKRMA